MRWCGGIILASRLQISLTGADFQMKDDPKAVDQGINLLPSASRSSGVDLTSTHWFGLITNRGEEAKLSNLSDLYNAAVR